jgi:hypothetical protein
MGSVYSHHETFAHMMSFREFLEPTHIVQVSITPKESELMIQLEKSSKI